MTIFTKKFNAQRSADRQTKRTGEPHVIEPVTGGGFMVVLASSALPEPTAEVEAPVEVEAPAEVERDGWMQVDTSVLADDGAVEVVAPVEIVANGAKPANGIRALIIEAYRRPEGASTAELYAVASWKHTGKTGWRFKLLQASKETGCAWDIRKVDGTTRYFLLPA